MIAAKDNTVGLSVWIASDGDKTKVMCRVMRREGGREYPVSQSAYFGPDKQMVEGLLLEALVQVNGDEPNVEIEGPEYRDVFSVGVSHATAMASILKRMEKSFKKEAASEFGDVFKVFAQSVGAEWVAMPKQTHRINGSVDKTEWTWWNPNEGRNVYRNLIKEAIQIERNKQMPEAA